MTTLKKNPYTPQSRMIAQELIKKIQRRDYQPGERLEGIRTLAEHFGVGRQVVLSAITLLAKQGYVYTVRGSGSYVNPALKDSFYYRLGWFVQGLNPLNTGDLLKSAQAHAMQQGFNLILGANFEEDFTLEYWLKHKGNLDGVVIDGIVDEKLLKYPKRHRIPYVVNGNFNILPNHPQVRVNQVEKYARKAEKLISRSSWQRNAIIAGTKELPADSDAVEGFAQAITACGREVFPDLLIHANGDGFEEICTLFEKKQCDVLFILGEHWRGFEKYCQMNSDFVRPDIVINASLSGQIPDYLYDYTLETNFPENVLQINNTIDKLIEIIKERK